MSDNKHTPGPWINNTKLFGPWAVCAKTTDEMRVICLMNRYYPPEGNSSLIAAAPEMLEALEAALPHIRCESSEQSSIIDLCGKAIMKAKGLEHE